MNIKPLIKTGNPIRITAIIIAILLANMKFYKYNKLLSTY